MAKKFLRRTWKRYPKLGKRRKKKQVWRRPSGRDNKMREKRKGYPAVVSVGYKKNKKLSGTIDGKNFVIVNNVNELEKIKKNELAILGSVGRKKKIEMLGKAKEKNIKIYNLNVEKLLNKLKKKNAKKEEKPNQETGSKKKKEKKGETQTKEKLKEKKK